MKHKAAPRRGKVRLAPGRRLQAAKRRDRHVLVSREGTVQLNETAASILALCDGTRTRDEIVASILRRPGDQDLAGDVRDFLDAARQRGWIIEG
jgi:pyrroloquinoline quinone biosynthesis protein D